MFKKKEQALALIAAKMDTLADGLTLVVEALQASVGEPSEPERIAELEARLGSVLGEVEGVLIKADALKAAARASEAREMGHRKRAEAALELAQSIEGGEEEDSFATIGRAYAGVVPEDHEATSEGLPPMRNSVGVGTSGRDRAKAAKRR